MLKNQSFQKAATYLTTMQDIHTTMKTSSHSHRRKDYEELHVFAATRYFSCEEDSKPPSIAKADNYSDEAVQRTERVVLENDDYDIKKKVGLKQPSAPRATITSLLNSFLQQHCRSSKKNTIKPSKSNKGNKDDHDGAAIKRKNESKSCNILSVPMSSTGSVTPSIIQSKKKYYDEDDYWKIVDEKKGVKRAHYVGLELEFKEKTVVREGCLDGHNGWGSDSSSDLFELNINNDSDDDDENGHVIYSNGVPVYESTKVDVVKSESLAQTG